MADLLIDIKNISKSYGAISALSNVSLQIFQGETLGLVGESGSGKTTLARIILKLIGKDSGEIMYKTDDFRRDFQYVFQDPKTSLNPKIKIGNAIIEPLIVHGICEDRAKELLAMVGLPASYANRYSHELSGGERQRVGIARAISISPKLIILDEPVSSLDLNIQVQILDLLKDLKSKLGLTYLFIAHDLAVIKYICDRVVVMKNGQIVETGEINGIFESPSAPYTKLLLSSSL